MARSNQDKRLLQEYDDDISVFLKRSLVKGFEDIPDLSSSIWKEKPVSIEVFCRDFIGEELYPLQLEDAEKCYGKNPLVWDETYDWLILFIGKGGGKDRTVAKLFAYGAYKIACLKNPHKFFEGIGAGSMIDFINLSFNAQQATDVFFTELKTIIKMVKNPRTKKNWFEERGADLREHEDMQKNKIVLLKGVRCHSLNSEHYSAEGYNVFMGVVDEKGAFKAGQGIKATDTLMNCMKSRFPKCGKVIDISKMYHHNDDMDIAYKETKGMDNVYRIRRKSWEYNLKIKKENFAMQYSRNKYKAMQDFECEGGALGGDAVSDKLSIDECFNNENWNKNPVKGNLSFTRNLFQLRFHDWFKDDGKKHTLHIDLAKGKESGCDAGIAMGHSEWMFPKYTRKKNDILTEEELKSFEKQQKMGVVIDFYIQLRGPDKGEIRISDVRRFVVEILKKRFGFNIVLVTYDGYASAESIQEFPREGIRSEKRSVEDNDSQETLITDFMGERRFKTYRNDVWHREARSLIREVDTGRINHPELDYERSIAENKNAGSDDVWKATVGVTMNCMEKLRLGGGIVF